MSTFYPKGDITLAELELHRQNLSTNY